MTLYPFSVITIISERYSMFIKQLPIWPSHNPYTPHMHMICSHFKKYGGGASFYKSDIIWKPLWEHLWKHSPIYSITCKHLLCPFFLKTISFNLKSMFLDRTEFEDLCSKDFHYMSFSFLRVLIYQILFTWMLGGWPNAFKYSNTFL